MQGNPFARANMIMAAIAAAMSLSGSSQREAMAGIGPYKSRGHGRGNRIPFGSSNHTVAMDRRGIRKPHEPKASRSKYTPHIGAKEQERAKRCYMDWTHGNDGALRSAPIVGQMSKATHEAYLEAREQEYESVF
jgi:hypothetical protein